MTAPAPSPGASATARNDARQGSVSVRGRPVRPAPLAWVPWVALVLLLVLALICVMVVIVS